ncbi:MAG: two-component system response regulator CreB [Pseudoxanthomonas suwonensis]|nr:MAG: two-component system response regulator CreB [Pseudoxanthomonas suwonensis]
MTTILLAEDESAIAQSLLFVLRGEGYDVEHVLLGGEVLPRVRRGGVDVVILDVGLPDHNGFDVCRDLRAISDVPVIFLTARDGEADRVLGLELGGDDYVAKPFSPRELVARVRARLRRGLVAGDDAGARQLGRFRVDAAGQRIALDGQPLDLTRYEHGLLAALLARPGSVLSRAQLMDRVWEDAPDTGDRTVDTHIKTLRAKLRSVDAAFDPIRTHRGMGYSIDVPR